MRAAIMRPSSVGMDTKQVQTVFHALAFAWTNAPPDMLVNKGMDAPQIPRAVRDDAPRNESQGALAA